MIGQLLTSGTLDTDGRQVVLSNNILDVFYYSTLDENWDKNGAGGQSWYREKFTPNDLFDLPTLASDRWTVINTPEVSDSTINQLGNLLNLGIERDEGTVALTSDGKWRLTGDFEIRLYLDWDSYYNEYRSVAHSYLKVGYDDENAARVAFTFDGAGYVFSSEKIIDRNPLFLDWQDNGSLLEMEDIDEAKEYLYLKITRAAGVVKTYVSKGSTETQVGASLDQTVFANDLFVEFGLEAKEYTTYRQSFSKIFFIGQTTPTIEFFNSSRGTSQAFPERAMLVVDEECLSIIDEANSTLWMRLVFDEDGPVPDNTTKVSARNGTIYCTTSNGLVALDFVNDRIFRYRTSSISVADEPLALRNSSINFRTHTTNIGSIPDNNFNYVACGAAAGREWVAATTDTNITIFKPLASGVATTTNGKLPAEKLKFSDTGVLYWAGYDGVNNLGSLSYYSGLASLVSNQGTTTFSRTGFYDSTTALAIFGEQINDFDVRFAGGSDQIAVATTEGITFLATAPGAPRTESISYGVFTGAENPFTDPSFENYIGLSWKPIYSGFHQTLNARRAASFSGDGIGALRLQIGTLPFLAFYEKDTSVGVYQDVDLTGISMVYFDLRFQVIGSPPATHCWNFEIVVNGEVVKSYQDIDGPFTKLTDSFDVSGYAGVNRVIFRLRIVADTSNTATGDTVVFVDNLRTKIGDPNFSILPPGSAAVKELLIQYDADGHKIYFASANGYGAIDLDDNSVDYFQEIDVIVPGADIQVGDFSRAENEV